MRIYLVNFDLRLDWLEIILEMKLMKRKFEERQWDTMKRENA